MCELKMDNILYGGDYNPEQWDKEVWKEDIRQMKHHNVNMVTVSVFSWAKLQPGEDKFNFEWLDEIFDLLYENGIFVNLATPTAAQPAWMSKKYPDILPVDKFGRKRKHGGRVNFCPNSPNYRKYSRKIAENMAERYKDHPALKLWHINNEYGRHCYCDNCKEEFREWLKEKYGSIEALNEAWYSNFWGHTYYNWDEIEVPSALNEILPGRLGGRDGTNFQAMAVDYKRFMSESILGCFLNEKEVIKKHTPDIPVTTNIWGVSPALDLFQWAEHSDIASWDNYPTNKDKPADIAMKHDIIRSLKKGKPFILMEQTPSQQNWQDYNALKRPGEMRLQSYQTIAHGADGIMFFQWRQSKGACEKYHAAMVPHVGHENTRTGRELTKLGNELKSLNDEILGSEIDSKVGILFDWDSWWSLEYSSGPSIDLEYLDQIKNYYHAFYDNNISVDFLTPYDDLSNYEMIVAPVFYMVDDKAKSNIEKFVKNGGVFITTFMSGMVDKNDQVYLEGYPGAFRDLLGIWVEETDALYPDMRNQIVMESNLGKLSGEYDSKLICDVINIKGADVIARFGSEFYAGKPAITENVFGKGKAIYIATEPEEEFLKEFVAYYCLQNNINQLFDLPAGIEITERKKDESNYLFLINHNDHEVEIELDNEKYFDLLNNKEIEKSLILQSKDVKIIKK